MKIYIEKYENLYRKINLNLNLNLILTPNDLIFIPKFARYPPISTIKAIKLKNYFEKLF